MKIIACDFDGTLCENAFPQIGAPRTAVINRLKEEATRGARLILWTCREGEMLEQAVAWCQERGVVFDAINDNLPESCVWLGQNCRKVFAHEYWDDRSLNEF